MTKALITRYFVATLLCISGGMLGWTLAAEYTAWQNTKQLLPQIIKVLNDHEAVLKTQKPAP